MYEEEEVSSASTATSISPLSPVFGPSETKSLMDLQHGKEAAPLHEAAVSKEHKSEEEEEEEEEHYQEESSSHAALLTRPSSNSFDEYDVDGGLFVDQDEDASLVPQQQHGSLLLPRSSSHVSLGQLQHKRLPSTIYEEDQAPSHTSTSPSRPLMRSNRNSHGSSLGLAAMADESNNNTLGGGSSSMMRIGSFQSIHEDESQDSNSLQQHPLLASSPSGLRRTSRSTSSLPSALHSSSSTSSSSTQQQHYTPYFTSTRLWHALSQRFLPYHTQTPLHASTWLGFWALLHITCANYVLTPLRDAIALRVGLDVLPLLTLASTAMAFGSSVPIGWLFEAPDPARRKWWKKMGLTRGQTQGTSLALFYRCFAWFLLVYGVLFCVLEWIGHDDDPTDAAVASERLLSSSVRWLSWRNVTAALYIVFYLVVHLMKLHSLSLVWGVTTEAMEYEEVARQKMAAGDSSKTRLQELALVGFGGTLGGVLGR